MLKRLVKADRLEGFLARNFPSAKRFGLEGAETLIPGLQAIVESAAAGECPYASPFHTQMPNYHPITDQSYPHSRTGGAESVVIGMAHRGRLNVLNNIFGKPLGLIATEMRSGDFLFIIVWAIRMTSCFVHRVAKFVQRRGRAVPPRHADRRARGGECFLFSYCVPIGTFCVFQVETGFDTSDEVVRETRQVEMSMAPNPSHLEAVNSVVAGMVRSKQMRVDTVRAGRGRVSQRKVMGECPYASPFHTQLPNYHPITDQ